MRNEKICKNMCGPCILDVAFSFNGETHFSFIYLVKIWFFFRKDLESLLIFVLFLKGKQNKKENPKCDSLFGKDGIRKTKSRLGGQVTYWEGTIKTIAPL